MTPDATVFVVDDDPDVRSSLSLLLRTEGLPCEDYDSAGAFLAAYDPTRSGCLVLDNCMPDMTGFQLQALLKQRGFSLPIIIITARTGVAEAVQAMRTGAFDFFEKPFDADALLARIRQALHDHEPAGMLTRVARQLTPDDALELYRTILPRLILQVLEHLDRSANVDLVRRVTEHMCRADVQETLRESDHVRDAVVSELCKVLNDGSIQRVLDRGSLLDIMQASGVTNNLATLEACLLRLEAA